MGYVVGAIAGLILAGFAGQFLLHDFQSGLLPGLALALWIGSFINHDAKEEKLNMLFPIPFTYPMPVKQAFPKIKKTLREFTHDYGKSFKLHKTNPSQSKEIKADMTWTDTDEVPDPTQNDYGKVRKTTVKRHIRLEIYFSAPTPDSTTVEIRWYPMAEGLNPRACEPIIKKVNEEILALLGEGTTKYPAKQPWIPPSWLHISTAVCIGLYVLTAFSHYGNVWKRANDLQIKADKKRDEWITNKKNLEAVVQQWDEFKRNYKPTAPTRIRDANEIFGKPEPPPDYQTDRLLNPKMPDNSWLFKKQGGSSR